jgi:allantoate deiminase
MPPDRQQRRSRAGARHHRRRLVVAAIAIAALALATTTTTTAASLLPPSLYRHVLDVELNRHVEELGTVTESGNISVLTRTYMSAAHSAAARRVKNWLEQAGASKTWIDPVGNVHGHFQGQDPSAPVLVAGSHYDTVVDGGKYDGTMGVLVAVAAAKALALEASAASSSSSLLLSDGSAWSADRLGGPDVAVSPPPPAVLRGGGLRVVAFADEEGIRFRSTFLGSRALAGTLVRYGQLDAADAQGVTLADVIAQGLVEEEDSPPPSRSQVERAVLERAALTATGSGSPTTAGASKYVEVHIEQGPVLESLNEPLGVVAGISGQTWLAVSVEGEQAHAGTVPMGALRRDALAAAAQIVSSIERLCTQGNPEKNLLHDPAEGLVCTVGAMTVKPGQVNVVPRLAEFTVDVRSGSDAHRSAALSALKKTIEEICESRGVGCEVKTSHDAKAVRSDAGVVEGLKRALEESRGEWEERVLAATGGGGGRVGGGASLVGKVVAWARGVMGAPANAPAGAATAPAPTQAPVPVLLSGAGHDAMAVAEVAPVGMVFVRCRGGVSHNPAEYAAPEDVARSAHALFTYFRRELLDGGAEGARGGEL